jgi:hypothetical protein
MCDYRSDPIEPADDLVESTPRGEPVVESRKRSPTPSQSPRKYGVTKRMKARGGKVLSNVAVDLEEAAESTPLRAAGTTRSFERSPSASAVPPPVVPAVKELSRRGRPPLSHDAKAAREKDRAEIKVRKAEEKARKDAARKMYARARSAQCICETCERQKFL